MTNKSICNFATVLNILLFATQTTTTFLIAELQ